MVSHANRWLSKISNKSGYVKYLQCLQELCFAYILGQSNYIQNAFWVNLATSKCHKFQLSIMCHALTTRLDDFQGNRFIIRLQQRTLSAKK